MTDDHFNRIDYRHPLCGLACRLQRRSGALMMETVFIVFGFISAVWSGTMGYTVNLDIATLVMIAGFAFLIAFKRGAHHRRLTDAAVASSQEMNRRQGFDEDYNAREERKLKAEKERWWEWTVERDRRKEEQAERQKQDALTDW